jgi:glycosyltransferase involved in cell wall biosynthesis
LKILLSAFACEPGVGSEFEIGWNWATGLAEQGHDVTVLTRSISRSAIERAIAHFAPRTKKPRFAYFDLSPALRWESRGPLHIHCMIWQRAAARFAQRLYAQERFDCVHHVTYSGLRAASFMGRLGIPFIFGPVGGGESAPWRLRLGYTWHGLVLDAVRDLANALIWLQPTFRETFARATRVYVTSVETLRLMPAGHLSKTTVELAIGSSENAGFAAIRTHRPRDAPFRVLYAGRFVDYKGMHLGLPAFAQLLEREPRAQLTMVGGGITKEHWRRLAARLGLDGHVTWLPWQSHEAMSAIYAEHDVLLFPSLHDTGGLVVLEAMNHGLPVVCLRLGGPGVMVNQSCGRSVEVAGKSRATVIAELGDALGELADADTRRDLSDSVWQRCRDFSWRKKIERIYGLAS